MACNATTVNVLVPGPKGDTGIAGTNGTNGVDAFTTTTAEFSGGMPAEGANVTVSVGDSTWMSPNQVVYVQGAGWMEVQSKPTTTSVILKNLAVAASSKYIDNVAPSTAVSSGKLVSPGGLQGPTGSAAAAGAPSDAGYWVTVAHAGLSSEIAMGAKATGLVQNTTGTGNPFIRSIGVADDDILEVDDAAGLVNGEACFATANGIETLGDVAAFDALSPTTTKGDVILNDGTNNIRVAVGTNGQSLIADSSQASGVKWGDSLTLALFKVTRSAGTNQSITNGSPIKIQFDNEDEDPSSYYDNAINYRFTPLSSGLYQVTLNVTYTNTVTANARFSAMVFKNGGSVYERSQSDTSWDGTYLPSAMVVVFVRLNGSTDYIEAYTKHDDTVARNMIGAVDKTWFQAHRVSE